MKKLSVLILFGFWVFAQTVFAAPPKDLTGTYVYQGHNSRDARISKIQIRKDKGQTLVHVWFFGLPDDVDWGEVVATEYKYDPMAVTPELVATMQHGEAKAIVAIRVEVAVNEDIKSISTQSWMSWMHPDEKHINESARDTLANLNRKN